MPSGPWRIADALAQAAQQLLLVHHRIAFQYQARQMTMRMAIDGGLFVARTSDGGQFWQPLRNGLPQENAHDIVLRHGLDAAGDCLCFGSTTGNVYLSEDRGET